MLSRLYIRWELGVAWVWFTRGEENSLATACQQRRRLSFLVDDIHVSCVVNSKPLGADRLCRDGMHCMPI
jgi:hypothetical protein